jgi:hypothetical protein
VEILKNNSFVVGFIIWKILFAPFSHAVRTFATKFDTFSQEALKMRKRTIEKRLCVGATPHIRQKYSLLNER